MTDSDDDKTRIVPRKPLGTAPSKPVPKGEPYNAGSNVSSKVPGDVELTPERSRSKQTTPTKSDLKNPLNPDKTRFKTPSRNRSLPPEASGDLDKTVFKPRPKVADSRAHDNTKDETKDATKVSQNRVGNNTSSRFTNDSSSPQPEATRVSTGRRTTQTQDSSLQVPNDRTRMAPRKPISGKQRGPSVSSDSSFSSSDQQRAQLSHPSRADVHRSSPISEAHTIPPGALNTNSPGSAGRVINQDGVPELLKERFQFEQVLGAGGMGVVYKAKDLLKVEAQDKDPYVAIKLLGDEFKSHPEAFIALQRESRKTQRIAHPNIVNVHDFDRDGDTVFMTMEYLEGKPLDKLISQYKTTGLPEEDAWTILKGISAALVHAHAENIIHSDFKPGNIFVTSKGLAKVFDFGIARAVAKAEKFEESQDDKTVFDAGSLGALTPAYASLEMLEGDTPDTRDDIYALGCIAYEMFTGNHPFNRVHANEAMRLKMKAKRIPGLPKRQWKVIEQAIAFKREDRIASVAEFWTRLTRKKSRMFLVASFVGLIVVGLTGALAYQFTKEPQTITINEDDVRSEIERQFLIEQNTKDLNNLIGRPVFSQDWEDRLWVVVENLRKLLGEEDAWLLEQKTKIFDLYVANINQRIESQAFDRARELILNAPRYANKPDILAELSTKIDDAELALANSRAEEEKRLAQKRSNQQKVVAKQQDLKERNAAFDVALQTVNNQLKCRTTITMRDIDIAVTKLRELNLSRYQKAEREIVSKLAGCISKIGQTFPERAGEFKSRAIRTFPDNSIIANIKINPKDPCDLSLAGLGSRGSRAICRDLLKYAGDDLGRGPSMVVIPAKGSVKAFAIGKYELTYEDFNKFCTVDSSCSPNSSNASLPVTSVSSQTITKYLSWLSTKTKRTYRLPKRSEWIYAARANTSKMDSNRNCLLDSRGIKKGGALIKASVGQQNPWGLVNYLGNAQELVADGRSYAAVGGSYETRMEDCVVNKTVKHSGNSDKTTGFRILREIDTSS